VKPALALAVTLLFGTAPFQCANDPEPAERLEDSPAEALWNLAERFHEQNMEDARRQTLHQIIDQYPSSREAGQAQLILDGRELTPQPTAGAEADGTARDAGATGARDAGTTGAAAASAGH
jgi:hypothetical protein